MQRIILSVAMLLLIPSVYVAVAHAEEDFDEYQEEYEEYEEEAVETRAVAKRMNCDDIKKEIDVLSADLELDEDGVVRLTNLKSDYRSKCMKRTGGARRVGGRVKAVANNPVPENTNVGGTAGCDNPDADGCCPGESLKDLGDLGFNCCTENNEHCFPPMTSGKVKKMCDDGANPDKNGCCSGEKYTDLGDLGFNCCLPDGKTCFPPIK